MKPNCIRDKNSASIVISVDQNRRYRALIRSIFTGGFVLCGDCPRPRLAIGIHDEDLRADLYTEFAADAYFFINFCLHSNSLSEERNITVNKINFYFSSDSITEPF